MTPPFRASMSYNSGCTPHEGPHPSEGGASEHSVVPHRVGHHGRNLCLRPRNAKFWCQLHNCVHQANLGIADSQRALQMEHGSWVITGHTQPGGSDCSEISMISGLRNRLEQQRRQQRRQGGGGGSGSICAWRAATCSRRLAGRGGCFCLGRHLFRPAASTLIPTPCSRFVPLAFKVCMYVPATHHDTLLLHYAVPPGAAVVENEPQAAGRMLSCLEHTRRRHTNQLVVFWQRRCIISCWQSRYL